MAFIALCALMRKLTLLMLLSVTLPTDIFIHCLEFVGVRPPKSTRLGYVTTFVCLTLVVNFFWVGSTKTTTPTVSSLASWFFSDRLASFTIEIHDSVPSALLLLIRAIVLGSFSIVLLLYRFLVSLLWILTLLISSHMQIVLLLVFAAIWF